MSAPSAHTIFGYLRNHFLLVYAKHQVYQYGLEVATVAVIYNGTTETKMSFVSDGA